MTHKTVPDVPDGMQKIYKTLRALAEFAPRPFADSESVVGIRRGGRSGTRGLPHCHDLAPGVRQAEAHDEVGCARQEKDRIAGEVPGVGRAPSGALWARADGVCYRVGRAAGQDARPVERRNCAGSRWIEPRPVGVGVIQITSQMRILVAIEPVDGRKGIDSLARLCQDKLQAILSRDACLYSGAGAEPRSASWSMTAKGSVGAETAVAGAVRVVAERQRTLAGAAGASGAVAAGGRQSADRSRAGVAKSEK
jgi:hypothetical protein